MKYTYLTSYYIYNTRRIIMTQKNKNNNNVNPFNYIAKKYSSYIFDETTKYQKKYDFEIGTGTHATWNNEADAFKHTYMQAQLALWTGKHIAKALGDRHEKDGNTKMGQSKDEENMDKWNNAQGREIAEEIIREYGVSATIPSEKINNIIAQKVMERMNNGKLITKPEDKRIYNEGKSTGQAAPINHIFTPQEIGKMSSEEFSRNENVIMEQLKNGQIKYESPEIDYDNYKNPETGAAKIFTREDISQMPFKEYAKYEKEIMAQHNSIGIPYQKDLPKTAETHSAQKSKKYSDSGKSKSSNSKGGTAEGKWVTINGNHVLIKD